MKSIKHIIRVLSLAVVWSFISCSSSIGLDTPVQKGETVCFTASASAMKTYTKTGQLTWSEGDVILIGTDKYDVTRDDYASKGGALVTLTSSDISSDGRTASFTVSGLAAGAKMYYAAASDKISRVWKISATGNVVTSNYGGGTRDGEFPRIAVASCPAKSSPSLSFANADCIIHWSDPQKAIRGIRLVDPDGSSVMRTYTISTQTLSSSDFHDAYAAYRNPAWNPAEDMYICLAPGMSFPHGLQVLAYSNPWCNTPEGGDVSDKYYIGQLTTPAINTESGLFLDLGDLNDRLEFVNPLKSVSVVSQGEEVYNKIDQENRIIYIHHVPSGDLITNLTFTCEKGYAQLLTGEWPTKTVKFMKRGQTVQYLVKLVDYCGPDDYFKTLGGTAFLDRTWNMVWNDEFRTDYLETSAWARIPAGSSAWDAQMDANNADLVTCDSVQDAQHHGHVTLWAKSGTNTTAGALNEGFVTGGITTAGKHKISVPEGGTRIDIRAWVDAGKGFWPAIWMTNYSNVSQYLLNGGELDICEFEAEKNKKIFQTFHTNDLKNNSVGTISSTGQWHMYTVIIKSDETSYYIDGVKKHTLVNSGTQSSYPFYGYGFDYRMILSAQLSSSLLKWQGQSLPDASQMPLALKIDFVRCYY